MGVPAAGLGGLDCSLDLVLFGSFDLESVQIVGSYLLFNDVRDQLLVLQFGPKVFLFEGLFGPLGVRYPARFLFATDSEFDGFVGVGGSCFFDDDKVVSELFFVLFAFGGGGASGGDLKSFAFAFEGFY